MYIIKNKFITNFEDTIKIDDLWADDFLEVIRNPQFDDNYPKEQLPALVLADFKDIHNGRNMDNCLDVDPNWLGLDFDDNIKIDNIRARLRKYRYILYTTSSHTEEHHKFRVFLWCKNPMGLSRENWRVSVYREFNEQDRQACDKTRLFYLPKKTSNYYFDIHDGIQFELKRIELPKDTRTIISRHENKSCRKRCRDVYNSPEVQYYLNTSYNSMTGNGDSNTALYNAIVKCLANGDEGTLNCYVIPKAELERWSSKEIEYKISCAKKFLK